MQRGALLELIAAVCTQSSLTLLIIELTQSRFVGWLVGETCLSFADSA